MKPLLLSFFVVILCYSLFFDEGEIRNHVDDPNYTIQSDAYERVLIPDSASLYAETKVVSE